MTDYSTFSWLPTMLTNEGVSVAIAGLGLTAYNLGGVLGAMVCAYAVTRFGRLGAILSSFVASAMIPMGGAVSYFAMLGVSMAVVVVALWLVRNQIRPVSQQ